MSSLTSTLAAPAELEPGLEAATMRRVGRRLIPLLFCLYNELTSGAGALAASALL